MDIRIYIYIYDGNILYYVLFSFPQKASPTNMGIITLLRFASLCPKPGRKILILQTKLKS